jgi:hypothetical protein
MQKKTSVKETMKTINLKFYGSQNFDGKKTFTIVEDEEISISKQKRRQCDYTFKNVDFFNSGYKYSMDILQDVRS